MPKDGYTHHRPAPAAGRVTTGSENYARVTARQFEPRVLEPRRCTTGGSPMRPKGPHIATFNQVRIRRTGESAVIEYLDPAILPVVISIGPDADRLSDADLLDRHNAHLREAEALTKGRQHVVVEIPPGRRQIEYSVASGHWVPRGGVLRCLIDENPTDQEPVIHVASHELSWQASGRLPAT